MDSTASWLSYVASLNPAELRLLRDITAINSHSLTGDKGGCTGAESEYRLGDLLRSAHASHR
jgi:hypothetical protein